MELRTLDKLKEYDFATATNVAYGAIRILKHELFGSREEGISWEDKNKEFLSPKEREDTASLLKEIEDLEKKPLAKLSEETVWEYVKFISNYLRSLKSQPTPDVENEAKQFLQKLSLDLDT